MARPISVTEDDKKFGIELQHFEIAKGNGINARLFRYRVKTSKWAVERAYSQPRQNRYVWEEWGEIALSNGISRDTFFKRVYKLGMTHKHAALAPNMRKRK